MNRRQFLSFASMAAVAAGAAGPSATFAQELLQSGPSRLELNGRFAGWARVRGGNASFLRAPMDRGPKESLPPESVTEHLQDLNIAFSRGMSAAYYRWIETCLRKTQPAPAMLDSLRAGGVRDQDTHWTEAYVTRFYLPELDRTRHDALSLDATVRVGTVSESASRSYKAPLQLPIWRRSQFRFHISGIAPFGPELQRIGPLEFKRPLATNVLDSKHRNSVRAGEPLLPVLQLRLEGAAEQRLRQALEGAARRAGRLDLLSDDDSSWLRVGFRNLELNKDRPSSAGSGLDLVFTSATFCRLS